MSSVRGKDLRNFSMDRQIHLATESSPQDRTNYLRATGPDVILLQTRLNALPSALPRLYQIF